MAVTIAFLAGLLVYSLLKYFEQATVLADSMSREVRNGLFLLFCLFAKITLTIMEQQWSKNKTNQEDKDYVKRDKRIMWSNR